GAALAAPLLLAATAGGPGPATGATAASCQVWSGAAAPSPGGFEDELDGAVMLSPCSVWVVGSEGNGVSATKNLVEHWDGASWTVVPSPSPGTDLNGLIGAAAVSASNIWAVGVSDSGIRPTLVDH